jgi:carboxylate-amine ligase
MTRPDTFDWTFGIEEEFFLVDPRTRALVGDVPPSLLHACRRRYGDAVAPELLRSQVEIVSPVFRGQDEAAEAMTALRRGVADIACEKGLRVVAAGTHPIANWSAQVETRQSRYRRLVRDFQIVGRRNVLCGLHVHVAVPPDVDRVALMNRVMPWLPAFLALSTSSPFWDREPTGLLSYRQAAYDEWPRTGIPDRFENEAEYAELVRRLVAGGAAKDASMLWWAIRPALRYPTLELRICDARSLRAPADRREPLARHALRTRRELPRARRRRAARLSRGRRRTAGRGRGGRRRARRDRRARTRPRDPRGGHERARAARALRGAPRARRVAGRGAALRRRLAGGGDLRGDRRPASARARSGPSRRRRVEPVSRHRRNDTGDRRRREQPAERPHPRIAELVALGDERVALVDDRHESQPQLRGRGADAEADLRPTGGDGRRHRSVGELLSRPAADRARVDPLARDQSIDEDPRARSRLTIDEPQPPPDDVGERGDARRVPGRHDKALGAHDERDHRVARGVEARGESGVESGVRLDIRECCESRV